MKDELLDRIKEAFEVKLKDIEEARKDLDSAITTSLTTERSQNYLKQYVELGNKYVDIKAIYFNVLDILDELL